MSKRNRKKITLKRTNEMRETNAATVKAIRDVDVCVL